MFSVPHSKSHEASWVILLCILKFILMHKYINFFSWRAFHRKLVKFRKGRRRGAREGSHTAQQMYLRARAFQFSLMGGGKRKAVEAPTFFSMSFIPMFLYGRFPRCTCGHPVSLLWRPEAVLRSCFLISSSALNAAALCLFCQSPGRFYSVQTTLPLSCNRYGGWGNLMVSLLRTVFDNLDTFMSRNAFLKFYWSKHGLFKGTSRVLIFRNARSCTLWRAVNIASASDVAPLYFKGTMTTTYNFPSVERLLDQNNTRHDIKLKFNRVRRILCEIHEEIIVFLFIL